MSYRWCHQLLHTPATLHQEAISQQAKLQVGFTWWEIVGQCYPSPGHSLVSKTLPEGCTSSKILELTKWFFLTGAQVSKEAQYPTGTREDISWRTGLHLVETDRLWALSTTFCIPKVSVVCDSVWIV